MKAEREDIEVENFKPFNIKISVETEEDARALHAVFNLTRNRRLIGEKTSEYISDELIGTEFYVSSGVIANGVHYEDFYN